MQIPREQGKLAEAEKVADKLVADIWTQLRREHLVAMAHSRDLPNHPLPKNLQISVSRETSEEWQGFMP